MGEKQRTTGVLDFLKSGFLESQNGLLVFVVRHGERVAEVEAMMWTVDGYDNAEDDTTVLGEVKQGWVDKPVTTMVQNKGVTGSQLVWANNRPRRLILP